MEDSAEGGSMSYLLNSINLDKLENPKLTNLKKIFIFILKIFLFS
jgi:hypothetical protein